MYERFTDRARKVMHLANKEALRFNHEYIGTEHILMGLIKEGSGVAANVLKNLDVDLRKIRIEVEKLVQYGPDAVTMGKLPRTPRAKKVIEYSMEEACNLNHKYVGTEHLLLGLLREEEGVAARVLTNLGLKLEEVRREVLAILGGGLRSAGQDATSPPPSEMDPAAPRPVCPWPIRFFLRFQVFLAYVAAESPWAVAIGAIVGLVAWSWLAGVVAAALVAFVYAGRRWWQIFR